METIFTRWNFQSYGIKNTPGLTPAKKPYLLKDLKRLAEYYKFTLKMPADFPVRTVLAMRALSSLAPEEIPPAGT